MESIIRPGIKVAVKTLQSCYWFPLEPNVYPCREIGQAVNANAQYQYRNEKKS
jgi:hypothetical protein